MGRLLNALDGKQAWKLNGLLLQYLMAITTTRKLSSRIPQITAWLETHPDDTNVRAKYLSFLLELPPEFSNLRPDAARQTAKWLVERDEDTMVRTQYLSFLLQLPAEFSDLRADVARHTAEWLERYPDATNVRAKFLNFLSALKPFGEWQQFASDALNKAADLTIRSGWQRQHEVLIHSFLRLHGALFRSLRGRDSEAVRRVLQVSHDVAAEWCVRNASAGLVYDLPLP